MSPVPPPAPAADAVPPRARRRRLALLAAFAIGLAVVVVATWAAREALPEATVVADAAVEPMLLDAAGTAGALTEDDAEGPGGRRLDAWAFSTDTEEPITIFVAAAFVPTLAVRAPDGTVHEGRADSADTHVARLAGLRGKGRYTITVSTRAPGATGRYVLTVDQPPVPFELVVDGQPRPGELGVRARPDRDGRYEDRHAVDARRGQVYLAILEADSLFGRVIVRSPEGDSLRDVFYEQIRTARGTYASVARFTPRYPGRYLVGVRSLEPGGIGAYTLALRTRTDAVALGQDAIRGALGLVSQLRGEHYVDVFAFTADAGHKVSFEVRPDAFTVTLVTPDGAPLASGEGFASAVLPADGRYRVEVSSVRPRQTGVYDLIPSLPPPPQPDTARAAPTLPARPADRVPGRDGGRK